MKETKFPLSTIVINLHRKNYASPLSYTVRARYLEAKTGRLQFFAMKINK